MTATTHSTALATIQPSFTDAERLALAGFLAGYCGLTRDAYTLDLRQFSGWCRARSLSLFSVRRADIETFARELEALRPGADQPGPARHLYRCRVHRRSSQISPFHRICLAALGGQANPSLGAQLLRSSNVDPTHP